MIDQCPGSSRLPLDFRMRRQDPDHPERIHNPPVKEGRCPVCFRFQLLYRNGTVWRHVNWERRQERWRGVPMRAS
jgi:hypothetical protein